MKIYIIKCATWRTKWFSNLDEYNRWIRLLRGNSMWNTLALY